MDLIDGELLMDKMKELNLGVCAKMDEDWFASNIRVRPKAGRNSGPGGHCAWTRGAGQAAVR